MQEPYRQPGLTGFELKNQAADPCAVGVYDPSYEHDSCGVGFIASLDNEPRHDVVRDAIRILVNLEHRGAVGGDQTTGDGAGLLMGVPDAFLRACFGEVGVHLPLPGDYAVGSLFVPTDANVARACEQVIEEAVVRDGAEVLGWRDVPVEASGLGEFSRRTMPDFRQVMIGRGAISAEDFERKLYVLRRSIEKETAAWTEVDASQFYICSLSSRTLVYKGMLTGTQLESFFPDLADERFATSFALVHQRYSTNTLPAWSLAQPFRMLAHNGEINTLRGNVNRMRGREATMESELFGERDLERIKPVIQERGSDSAIVDNVLELLVRGGRSLPHSMMMMVPEAWGNKYHMSQDKRAFYEFHSAIMEPWDGPAALVFTDGRFIGATLDRNGLRPARYALTRDNRVVMASETGVLEFAVEEVRCRGRLQPGRMLLLDLDEHRLVPDREVKARISRRRPYRHWVRDNRIELRGMLAPASPSVDDPQSLRRRQVAFGYTEEELSMVLSPMASRGQEAIGSMGNDTPLAVLSSRPQLLFSYFKQLFAQVTNPAIDPLREELVMSLMSYVGREGNILDETPQHCRQVKLHHPILTRDDVARLRNARHSEVNARDLDMLFPVADSGAGLSKAIKQLCDNAEDAVRAGTSFVILTDRNMDAERAPIPVLLAASAVHHHLIRCGLRTAAALVVETGEAREVIHFAMLIGYGTNAICPYVALETVRDMADNNLLDPPTLADDAIDNYIAAVKKGLMKTLSRMGISTIRSFLGSQIFEAVGLAKDLVDTHFAGTASRIQGVGLAELGRDTVRRYTKAWPQHGQLPRLLDIGGNYHVRVDGEKHLWSPEAITKFQQAVRNNDFDKFREYAAEIDDQTRRHTTLRSLFSFRESESVPLEDVETWDKIVQRFFVSAMSFGSISKEAHEAISIAVNRIGAFSNSGEGGEAPERTQPLPNGDLRMSKVRQIASGRFGVTTEYLVAPRELQIKVAQGAKPGEGGQLPGHKVTEEIARVRHTIPGVTLISPPPHHDIYSIEDLAQLIYDLKTVNAEARVSVKLVSEVGVGTIAAGVAKARADMVQIAGHDGGTGASPLTAIKHAGLPWELGLAETQLSLRQNGLRDKIRVQVDGQLRTGRDLAIGALLGAEEFGFATPILVCLGCIMMRKCHSNTCPVGVATQDPKLRARFTGKPDYIVNYLKFLAEDLRGWMAKLGFRSVDEMVGRVDRLEFKRAVEHWKLSGLDLTPLLYAREASEQSPLRCMKSEWATPVSCFDDELIDEAAPALKKGQKICIERAVHNVNRTVGARLSAEVVKHCGAKGLPDGTIDLRLTGSAGQSLGAFLAGGIDLTVIGDANDYIGKGLFGGRIILKTPDDSLLDPRENVIGGNVMLYGATRGECFVCGQVGERFAVRNSGARAVVEGLGDHGCEYMTGGLVVVLGNTGVNFAAGMSGGTAYVYDETGLFDTRCNLDMVDVESVWSDDDQAELKAMLERHIRYTGSQRASDILDNWENRLPYFVKVMPIEYRRVLDRMKENEDRNSESVSATEEVFMA
ncbi:MAG: glutamate synthase large subunit [Verrucomicrobiota bacterium]